jgi:hypothetical protein
MSTSSQPKSAAHPSPSGTRRRDLGFQAPLALAALALALLPAAALAASISVEGDAVVLGRTESAKVLLQVDEPPTTAERPLRLSVNVGSFSEPEHVGPGRYRAVYVPPRTRSPQTALVAVWRETGAEEGVELLRLPLFGTTRLSVKAPAGSAVSVKVGPAEFGPVTASQKGEAIVPIVAAPGVREATVSISGESGPVTRKVALDVPPYNRLVAAVVPGTVPADGKTPVRVDVFYDADGAEVPASRVRVVAGEGQVALVAASGGRYSYRYLAPAGTGAREVRFQISVDRDPAAAASARLSLVTHPPLAVSVHGPPAAPVAAVQFDAGRLERTEPAPLAPNHAPLLMGPRVGLAYGSGDPSGVRLGLDAWVPVRLGRAVFGLGFSVSHGGAARTVADPGGTLRSSSSADFYPLVARLGYEVWAGRRLSFTAGLGYTAAFAFFTSSLGGADSGIGTGPLGFAAAACAIGPGQLFVEATVSRTPVATPEFKLEAGGLSLDAGYRLGLF